MELSSRRKFSQFIHFALQLFENMVYSLQSLIWTDFTDFSALTEVLIACLGKPNSSSLTSPEKENSTPAESCDSTLLASDCASNKDQTQSSTSNLANRETKLADCLLRLTEKFGHGFKISSELGADAAERSCHPFGKGLDAVKRQRYPSNPGVDAEERQVYPSDPGVHVEERQHHPSDPGVDVTKRLDHPYEPGADLERALGGLVLSQETLKFLDWENLPAEVDPARGKEDLSIVIPLYKISSRFFLLLKIFFASTELQRGMNLLEPSNYYKFLFYYLVL